MAAVLSIVVLLAWPKEFRPHYFVRADIPDLIKLMDITEKAVKEFVVEVENAHEKRCLSPVMRDCEGSQYNPCWRALSNDTKSCVATEYSSTLVDFKTAMVNIPVTEAVDENFTPLDPKVIETVCLGQRYDNWMKDQLEDKGALYEAASAVSEMTYLFFGASDGVFRIYPARSLGKCGYDPRSRPWYLAASSTPKAVVIVVDIAGHPDLEYVKETVGQFVQAVSINDLVSVVFMGGTPEVVGYNQESKTMDRATHQVQTELKKAIADRKASSTLDAKAAFDLTFDVLENTIKANVIDCDVAVTLFTSHRNLEMIPKALVVERKKEIERLVGRSMLFFGYSSGNALSTKTTLAIECNLGAVWSIVDSSEGGRGIVRNIRLFHEAFAFNMGRSVNPEGLANVVTWSDIVLFFNPEVHGAAVSSPVFDRKKSPPVFLGVASIALPSKAFEEKAKQKDAREVIQREIMARQQRQCGPSFTSCDLEALRRRARRFHGSSSAASAPICAERGMACGESDIPFLDRGPCPENSKKLAILWGDSNMQCPNSESGDPPGGSFWVSGPALVVATLSAVILLTLLCLASLAAASEGVPRIIVLKGGSIFSPLTEGSRFSVPTCYYSRECTNERNLHEATTDQ